MSIFRRIGRRPDVTVPYVADNTTWTCNACKTRAWVSLNGKRRGCGCAPNVGARPLVADDPDHWSNRPHGEDPIADRFRAKPETDPRDELIEALSAQLALTNEIMTRQSGAISAARHLMRVLTSESATGPIFRIDDAHDDASIELIRHAILDLQSRLNGTEPPKLCLPERTH